ncbi:endothelin-converting enzyme 2-like [Argiope bruennichi]|uniref:endothelin-converting enzyme 2-like n=1 Tax=Argiope bruennichi TaxID=94029 RepID=UPI002495188E|nr:endothelin-converting enzyme 2-like [Argiope bruennichi]
MNVDVDPCEDFYEYSCGGYAKSIDVPSSLSIFNPSVETRLNIIFDIKKVMESPSDRNDSQTTRKMKELYRFCMNSEQRNIQQKLSLERWFSEIELKLDGFHTEYEIESATHISWKTLVSRLEEYQIHTIVKPRFKSSANTPIEKIEIDCAIPFFDPKVYLNITSNDNSYLLSLYKNYIKDALTLLPMKDAAKRRKFLDDVIQIETDVATAIKNTEDPPNPTISSENTLLLKDLWRTIIGDAIQEVEVQSVCKYNLDSILSTLNNADPEKVTSYVTWRMLSQLIPYLGNEYRKLYLRHVSELPGRGTAFKSLWQECSDLIRNELGLAAFKALVDADFFNIRQIQETKDAFLEVKKNFLLTFQSIEWARGIIKKLFLEKVQRMKINLGIPDTITQPNILDDVFRDLEFEDNFLLSVTNLKKFKTRYFFTRLWYGNSENAPSKISLEENPLSGTSSYDYITNTVRIDIGLLYPPLFLYSGNIPKYFQFGEYSLLASQMTHAFDTIGSFYDGKGRKWGKILWPQIMEEKYDFYVQCLQNQTEVLRNSSEDDNKELLNTIITDIGSFLVLYDGLVDHLETWKNEKHLPGLDVTKEQLYYVRIAQRYCEQRKSSMRLNDEYNLPARIRVNTAVSNTKDFGEVYGCPPKSTLNPELKCNLL